MSRKGKSRGLPSWYKGQLLRDISGFWYGSREGKLFEQEGKLKDRKNFDSVTDLQREEAIQRILNRSPRSEFR